MQSFFTRSDPLLSPRSVVRAYRRRTLLGFTQPGILPRHRHILIVSTIPYVGGIVVTEFQNLVRTNRHRERGADAGVPLQGELVFTPFKLVRTAKPEVPVERDPQPRVALHIVTQVPFEGADRFLRLSYRARVELVVRKKLGIGSEEPHASVRINHPLAPAPGEPSSGLKAQRLALWLMSRVGSYWPGRSRHGETGPDEGLLSPGTELLWRHGRSAFELDGKAKDGVQKA